jgi:hypothetical protein
MARTRAVDRVLHKQGRGPWFATGAIAVLGVVLLLWFVSPTERKRRSTMSRVPIGADTAEVLRLLGQPVRCPPKSTEQVRAAFPTDWPPRQVETAVSRMDFATRQRWVYPINLRGRVECDASERHTEIGIDESGRVLWSVPITGRTPIRLPDDYTPSGAGS